jgi:hypothetical protein
LIEEKGMSNAPNNPSSGVYTSERDLSTGNREFSTSNGVIVSPASRGPVNKRIRNTNDTQFKRRFGENDFRLGFGVLCGEHFLEESTSLYFTRIHRNGKMAGILIRTVSNFAAPIQLAQGIDSLDQINFGPDDIMYIAAENPGVWGDDSYVVLYPDTNDPDNEQFFLEWYEGESTVPSERYVCTTFYKRNDLNAQLFVEDVVNALSENIRVKFNWNHSAFVNNERPVLINAILGGPADPLTNEKNGQFSGGSNGDPVTIGDHLNAWELYRDEEFIDVDILINCGFDSIEVKQRMDDIASSRLDCICIHDLPNLMGRSDLAVAYRRDQLLINSSSSALYGPYLKMVEPVSARNIEVPISGKVAAIFARTDRTAAWLAPAGETRGQITGINGLVHTYDLGDRNILTENQINYARSLEGGGYVIWNADTLYPFKSPLNDIGVRRLLAILHRSVRFNQLRRVFEPGDDFTRHLLRTDLESVCEPIRAGRGLRWFSVVCDDTNNSDADVSNGDLIVDVFLDPTRYTKRIHLNAIVAKRGGIKFAESLIDRS